MSKLKDLDYKDLPRSSKLANVLYSSHSESKIRKQMEAAASQEGKKPPSGPNLLKDAERGATSPLGGTANWTKP